tara:strand:+ start:375 stop:1364 length:990 start_codon:yes stop_codon:yes gene_type:complete
MQSRIFGKTNLELSVLGLGGGSFRSLDNVPTDSDAVDIVAAAFENGYTMIDTAPLYGDSERRIGIALRELSAQLPNNLVLNTKVGYRPHPFDYSYDATRKCVEESLATLGVTQLQLVHIHDVERSDLKTVMKGARRALHDMQTEGTIGYVGVSGGPVSILQEFIDTGEFDSLITHNRFNLLDQPAASLLKRAKKLGLGTINAAPFATGLLADPSRISPTHGYQPANPEVIYRALQIETICRNANLSIATVALRFSTDNPLVDLTVAGATSPNEARSAAAALEAHLPLSLLDQISQNFPPNKADNVELWRADKKLDEAALTGYVNKDRTS